MPIQFACEHCQKKLKVRDELAGKRIKCPQCQNATTVPAGTSEAGVDGWYLQTEDGETYGPVPRAELDAWAKEGRVTASSQVLREGADQWQWATDVYPHLADQAAKSPQSAGSAEQALSSPAAPSAPASQTSPGQESGGSGAFDFGAASQPAKKEAGPFDFAPSETSGAPAPAFDFGADAGRGGRRGRSKGGKSDKVAAPSPAPADAGGSSVESKDQPGYPPGVQPSAATSQPRMKTTGRMQRITKVGILSMAKVAGASGALMGLVIGIPYGLIVILVSLTGFAAEGGAGFGAMGIGFGLGMMIVFPLFYGVLSFIGGLIYALILNLVLGFTGGLEIELQ